MKNNLFMIVVNTIFNFYNSLALLNFTNKLNIRSLLSSFGLIAILYLILNITSNSFTFSLTSISQLSILPIFNLRELVVSLLDLILTLNSKVIKLLNSFKSWILNYGNSFKLLIVSNQGSQSKKLIIEVLTPHQDMKVLLFNLFLFLNGLEDYNKISNKSLLVTASDIDGNCLTLNKSFLIQDDMSFEEIYEEFLPTLAKINGSYYNIEVSSIVKLDVIIGNLDFNNNKDNEYNPFLLQKRGLHTSITRCIDVIKPLKRKSLNGKPFASMDIETMEIDNVQQPVLISITHLISNNGSNTQTFLLNPSLPLETALDNMWNEFFNYIEDTLPKDIKTIFVHNLGGFDGIYIYKHLCMRFNLDQINSIIDPDNKFIQISLNLNNRTINWIDSYRIFPVSLNQLCEVFNVKGKASEYLPEYQSISLFNNKSKLNDFINYSRQDTISLFNSVYQAQLNFISDFNVDITSVLSTSNLALKIFRSKFLDTNIPILKRVVDNFIRPGYFGGATDYYKAYGENLKYYDVNSLYPFAMLQPMPLEIIKHYKTMDNVSLDSVFGFFLCEVECPEDILHPILPHKSNGATIYPVGKWKGVYFSEELKNAVNYGYKVKLISGYEFSKYNLFSSYIQHFYEIKKNSSGAAKFISKLLLNTLYGVFGRKQDLIQTVNIHPKDFEKYLATHVVKSYFEINENVATILIYQNLNDDTIKKLNVSFDTDIINKSYNVKSNVAIAAAVTSYARVQMSKFKNHPDFDLFYTDTDSIIVDKVLPTNMIGDDLGLMKDELNGLNIKEAYFLGIKQYGYWFLDLNGQRIEKSVFAGVTRDSLSFKEVTDIFNGKTIVKTIKDRFFRSMDSLNVSIKDINISVMFKPTKQLINNRYMSIKLSPDNNNNTSIFSRFANIMGNIRNKFKK